MRIPFCAVVICSLLDHLNAQPGTLDPTFGNGGMVLAPVGASNDNLWDLDIAADDKIVVGGTMNNGTDLDAVLLRFNADGSVDSAFGTNGQVIFPVLSGDDRVRGVDMQADGKIVVTGDAENAQGNYQMYVARFLTDGALDNSFGGAGLLVRALTVTHDEASGRDVLCQADGSILIAGYAHIDYVPPAHYVTQVWKYTSGGYPDFTFGSGNSVTGYDILQNDLNDKAYSLVVRSDGTIALGGGSVVGADERMGMSLFTSAGNLAPGFYQGTYDFTTASDYANTLLLMPDGRYILVGKASSHSGMAAVLPTGGLDLSFGVSGKVTIQLGSSTTFQYGAMVHPWNKFLVTGYYSDGAGNTLFLARYNSDGSPDASFGTAGVVSYSADSSLYTDGRAIGMQSDGRIVVGGSYHNGTDYDYHLVRFTNDLSVGTSTTPAAVELVAVPNPFTGAVTVRGTLANAQLTVIDALGRLVHSARAEEGSTWLPLHDLPKGLYTVRHEEANGPVSNLRVVAE